MIRKPPRRDQQVDHAELYHLLKNHDPVAPPSRVSLATLEAGIFARIDAMETRAAANPFPIWMFAHSQRMQAAVLAVILIVVSGFILGRVSYGEPDEVSLANSSSLLVLADESSTPLLTSTLWGDDDDNDQ